MQTQTTITVGEGKSIEAFAKLLKAREKYLHETTEDAAAAIAINALISLRADTATAKPNAARKVAVAKSSKVKIAFPKDGSGKRHYQLSTMSGAKFSPQGNERITYEALVQPIWKNKVFEWADDLRGDKQKCVWFIIAPDEKRAKLWAQNRVMRRINAYAGLAKCALGILMAKTSTRNAPNDPVNEMAGTLARKMTNKTATLNNGAFNLRLDDMLDYAKAALKGGESSITLSLQKAANKMTGLINHKCKNLLGFEKIDTPFPEIRQRQG